MNFFNWPHVSDTKISVQKIKTLILTLNSHIQHQSCASNTTVLNYQLFSLSPKSNNLLLLNIYVQHWMSSCNIKNMSDTALLCIIKIQ